eukprot:CAMPEP_0168818940 /NCGR_PEP_ID=MMETSP0726-20121227/8024_1 /TAXON_ID=265536 /ORGANISM="Amphiprora sp., Strain CCMP467" /LENGTH=59 /DNA_ID=CAMNT_0008871299 /DNA_START=18 /DNA_END=193 /DNA_ORIENTATION=-
MRTRKKKSKASGFLNTNNNPRVTLVVFSFDSFSIGFLSLLLLFAATVVVVVVVGFGTAA